MKRIAVIFLAAVLCMSTATAFAAPVNPRAMSFPPLKFRIPQSERIVLANGMTVYLLEDHELPSVSIYAHIGTGSVYEPAGKAGLARLTGAVMRSGGTTAVTPEKLDDELEFMASSIDSSIGTDVGVASMNCLKRNLDGTLQIFAQVLMDPAFRPDRVELARKNFIEALRRENDDPKEVADRELRKAIYRGSPLGSYPTKESVTAITRADMVEFHKRYYHPNNVILSIAGDFTRAEMLKRLNQVFGSWKRQPVSFPPVDLPAKEQKQRVYLVKKDINQSVIRMGHLGIDKNNPDIYALRVMNFILGGGGFESKLMSQVRTREGLAYNVESDFSIGRRFPGTFIAETETRAESTFRTISLMKEIITGMTRQPVTDAEIRQARDAIINSFIFGFTSAASVVNQQAMLEYYGYPTGYLENFRGNIAKVTKEDVLRVAARYLHPDALFLVVVGNDSKFAKPLNGFGTVEEIRLKNEN